MDVLLGNDRDFLVIHTMITSSKKQKNHGNIGWISVSHFKLGTERRRFNVNTSMLSSADLLQLSLVDSLLTRHRRRTVT